MRGRYLVPEPRGGSPRGAIAGCAAGAGAFNFGAPPLVGATADVCSGAEMSRRRAPYGVAHGAASARLAGIVAVIAAVLCLASGCSGETTSGPEPDPMPTGTLAATLAPSPTGDGGSPPPTAGSPPPTVGSPLPPPLTGPNAQLAIFRQRCVHQTRVLDTATLYFNETVELRLSRGVPVPGRARGRGTRPLPWARARTRAGWHWPARRRPAWSRRPRTSTSARPSGWRPSTCRRTPRPGPGS